MAISTLPSWYTPCQAAQQAKPPGKNPDMLTTRQVAERLSCSIRTVQRLINNQALEALRVGGMFRLHTTALEYFIKSNWAA